MKKTATDSGILAASATALFVELTIGEENNLFQDVIHEEDIREIGEFSRGRYECLLIRFSCLKVKWPKHPEI